MEEKDAVKKALDFRKLKKENFVVLFLIGLLMLVIAWPPGNKGKGIVTVRYIGHGREYNGIIEEGCGGFVR